MKTLINRSFLILMFIAVFSGCEFNSVESPDTTATIEGVSTEEFIQATAGTDSERITEDFDMNRIFDKPELGSAGDAARPGFSYENPTLELSRDQIHHFNKLFGVYRKYNEENVFERDHSKILKAINRDL